MPKSVLAFFCCGVIACSGSDQDSSLRSDTAAIKQVELADTAAAIVAEGTVVQASIQEPVSSLGGKLGQRVKAVVTLNVADPRGRVMIPGGSEVVLLISELERPKAIGMGDGRIAFSVQSIVVGTTTYEPAAKVGAITHAVQPRITADVSARAPASTGASATGMSSARDLVVTPGTPITITLTQPLKISAI